MTTKGRVIKVLNNLRVNKETEYIIGKVKRELLIDKDRKERGEIKFEGIIYYSLH